MTMKQPGMSFTPLESELDLTYNARYGVSAYVMELGDIGGLITPVHSLMLNLSLPVYQVRLDWLPLSCIALIWPSQLSCLGNSVGRASASVSSMSWVQIPPEQLFFHFPWKRDVHVSCIVFF